MKYSEYSQLDERLTAKGTTILKELNEAEGDVTNTAPTVSNEPDKIDKEKTSLLGSRLFTRWGKVKNTLNKKAGKIQKQINGKILQKYLPKLIEAEMSIAREITKALEEKIQPKQVIEIVKNKRRQIRKLQAQQVTVVSKAISDILNNTSKFVEKKIDASKATDKNKLNLKNYWTLLESQLELNSLNFIQKTITQKVKEGLKNNPDAIKYYDQSPINNVFAGQTNTVKNKIEERKKSVTATEKNIKIGGGPEKTQLATTSEAEPEIGKKYEYTQGDKKYILVIKDKNADGSYNSETEDGKSTAILKPVMFKKLVPVKTETPTDTATATTTKSEGEREAKI